MLALDLDGTIDGPRTPELARALEGLAWVVVTGRHLQSARTIIALCGVPEPRAWVTGTGSQVLLDGRELQDQRLVWPAVQVQEELRLQVGLKLQQDVCQLPLRLSYRVANRAVVQTVRSRLAHLPVEVWHTGRDLDIMPIGVNKASGLDLVRRHLGWRRLVVAGDGATDVPMLDMADQSIVLPGTGELKSLQASPTRYLAASRGSEGVLQGLRYFRLLPHA